MNNLSWFIYLVDLAPKLGAFLLLLGLSLVMGYVVYYIIERSEARYVLVEDEGVVEIPSGKLYLGMFFILASLVIPSQETLYLIAGSEVSEKVINSEGGKDVLKHIQEVITHQLSNLKGGAQ